MLSNFFYFKGKESTIFQVPSYTLRVQVYPKWTSFSVSLRANIRGKQLQQQ